MPSMDSAAVALCSPGAGVVSQSRTALTGTTRNRGDGMTKGGGGGGGGGTSNTITLAQSLRSVVSATASSGQAGHGRLSSQSQRAIIKAAPAVPKQQHQQQQEQNSSSTSTLSQSAAPSSSSSRVTSTGVDESHAHLSALLDELVQLRQMNIVMSEQLADVTQERNGLRDGTTGRCLSDTRSSKEEPLSQLQSDSSSTAVAGGGGDDSCQTTELMRREMESLRVMNDQLTEENHRLLTERNNSVISNSRCSSKHLASSLRGRSHASRDNDMEYSALCAEVADSRTSSKELEMENQELSNDIHDMMIEVEELHRELDAKEKDIDSLQKEKTHLVTERDQIADMLWADREKVVDSSNYEEMIETAKQQSQAKMASLGRDKLLVEEKLNSVSEERDRLQTRVERLGEELDLAEASISESKKSIAKWKRVAGIISKEVTSHTGGGDDDNVDADGSSIGGDDRRRYHRNNQQQDDDDDDDDDSISVCTMHTYHATTELEKQGGGNGSRRKPGRRGGVSKQRGGTRRDDPGSGSSANRSVFNTNKLKEVTKNALSLTGLDDGFAPHKRLSEFAQSSSSFLSSVRSVSSRSNLDEPENVDSDEESIFMYPSLGSIAGK
jgi:hypothetical protein